MQHEIIVNAAAQHGRDLFDALTLVIGALGLYILGRYTNHAADACARSQPGGMIFAALPPNLRRGRP